MSADNSAPSFAPLSAGGAGFHGVMRRVGLQELLQLECLGRKSSIMEITTSRIRGRIYISDGAIVHAESGTMEGEVALYGLLALRGGQFNLTPFTEPSRRTISGQWEFLLMEAARISDEAPGQASSTEQEMIAANEAAAAAVATDNRPGAAGQAAAPAAPVLPSRTEEVVLCSGSGELLFQMNSPSGNDRRLLLAYLQEQVEELAAMVPLGGFDRLKISVGDERFLFQIKSDRRLMVRTTSAREL